MILILDNYDSFTYNLFHVCSEFEKEIIVLRNDELNPKESLKLNPTHLILSPGPGRPKDANYLEDYIKFYKDKIPILGICLGHQGIVEAFDGEIDYAKEIMHGKKDRVKLVKDPLFLDLPKNIDVARYHSLVAKKENLPECFKVIATSSDEEVMGVKHKEYPIWGLQFHPESILSPDGPVIIKNFLKE